MMRRDAQSVSLLPVAVHCRHAVVAVTTAALFQPSQQRSRDSGELLISLSID